ncbi:MAG: hypothetical protein M3R48_02645 [Candidatus Dormibacteraeota bacterium]|nr:hypothetical protein [Candidatus Dormibacteraeota bacterium]
MPTVIISFSDGEVLHAEIPELTFDLPVIEADVRGVEPNNQRAILPLTAITQIVVGLPVPAPDATVVAGWDRAAFHFLDGQVIRASIAPDAVLGRHGGIWQVVEPNGAELITLALPYCALKGVFQVRQWDSRPFADRAPGDRIDPVTRVLAERERHLEEMTTPEQRRPLMSRVGRRPPNA